MRLILTFLATAVLTAPVLAQGDDTPYRTDKTSPRLERLREESAGGDVYPRAEFWVERKKNGGPLVEPIPNDPQHVLLTFVYQGSTQTSGVTLVSQLSASRDLSANRLAILPGTDVWFKTFWVRSDLRLSYSFIVERLLPLPLSELPREEDPLNPRKLAPDTGVGLSYIELPRATPQPWTVRDPKTPQRELVTKHIESVEINARRRIDIYLPAAFGSKPARVRYPLIVFFDGAEYADPGIIPAAETLDNLTAAGKIPPAIAVFVHQAAQPRRNSELTNDVPFLNFVTEEVLPRIREDYHATSDPRQTVVVGSSTGGLAACFFALRRPDVYGNVLSQSGAFWPGQTREDPGSEWLTRQYETARKSAVRFVLQVGTLERWNTPGNRLSILDANRHLRNVLRAKGYRVDYAEMAGGHEPLSWRGGLADGLITLLGGK